MIYDDQDPVTKFRLASSINNYQEGTLLVAISKHSQAQPELMWEGAIQAYVIGEDLPPEERNQRLKLMIKRLMSGLPQAD